MVDAPPWIAITDTAYLTQLRAPGAAPHAMLTELLPDLGKARNPRTIAHRKFWLIYERLSARFTEPWYFIDVGCSRGKYTERLFVQHVATGAVFGLSTYFLCEWRINGREADRHLIPDFCAFVGIPVPDPQYIRRVHDEACTRAGLLRSPAPPTGPPPIRPVTGTPGTDEAPF